MSDPRLRSTRTPAMVDDLREQIARALAHHSWCWTSRGPDWPCTCEGNRMEDADALLAGPLREQAANAAQLRERLSQRSPVRQAATVLSDGELSAALDLWYERRAQDGEGI